MANLENNFATAAITNDGSTVVYITEGGALKKATFTAAPVIAPLVGAGVLGLYDVSGDSKTALFYTVEDATTGRTDVKTIDITAAAPAAVTIVAAPSAEVVGITAPGGHVVYSSEFTATTRKLKSQPVTGGAEKVLNPASYGSFRASAGTGALTSTNLTTLAGGDQSLTLAYVDVVLGAALVPVAPDMLLSQTGVTAAWSQKTLVYSNASAATQGIYALELP